MRLFFAAQKMGLLTCLWVAVAPLRLVGVIANEMLDWKFPDGTPLDGVSGGGIGYAQIAVKTARAHGVTGPDSEIKNMLNSYEGSVAVSARILKDYLEEFRASIKTINWEKVSLFQACILLKKQLY